jgi:hypothetical protein
MFGELHQPPGFPGINAANPAPAEQADYAAMQAYADMTAAMARYAQLLTASRQHAGLTSAMQFGPVQPALSPSLRLPAAKRAPSRVSLKALVVCLVIGAVGGFYARGQLPQQLHPSEQSRQ